MDYTTLKQRVTLETYDQLEAFKAGGSLSVWHSVATWLEKLFGNVDRQALAAFFIDQDGNDMEVFQGVIQELLEGLHEEILAAKARLKS